MKQEKIVREKEARGPDNHQGKEDDRPIHLPSRVKPVHHVPLVKPAFRGIEHRGD